MSSSIMLMSLWAWERKEEGGREESLSGIDLVQVFDSHNTI